MNLPAGTSLGRYRIDAYISEGGMQEVYKATDTLLRRTVALKRPKNNDGSRRFARSAQVSAKVSHANVTRTLDYIEHGNEWFLVEEFVDGLDLGQVLQRIPQFDPYIAARVLHGLVRGMAAMHEEGAVHRDLKPSNIMAVGGFELTDVKVTDFGVARMAGAEIDAGVAGGFLTITGSKTLIGHLPYLAPEIIRRRSTVHKPADIWAVGALAFHFLSGAPPFGDELEAVAHILNAPVPPLPANIANHPQYRGLAQEMYGIILACLQRPPESRPTARQLVGLCERLCYPVAVRERGVVSGYPGETFGFATSNQKSDTVFFHVASILGQRPRVGGEIWFSRHNGNPRDRAHPVVPMLPEEL